MLPFSAAANGALLHFDSPLPPSPSLFSPPPHDLLETLVRRTPLPLHTLCIALPQATNDDLSVHAGLIAQRLVVELKTTTHPSQTLITYAILLESSYNLDVQLSKWTGNVVKASVKWIYEASVQVLSLWRTVLKVAPKEMRGVIDSVEECCMQLLSSEDEMILELTTDVLSKLGRDVKERVLNRAMKELRIIAKGMEIDKEVERRIYGNILVIEKVEGGMKGKMEVLLELIQPKKVDIEQLVPTRKAYKEAWLALGRILDNGPLGISRAWGRVVGRAVLQGMGNYGQIWVYKGLKGIVKVCRNMVAGGLARMIRGDMERLKQGWRDVECLREGIGVVKVVLGGREVMEREGLKEVENVVEEMVRCVEEGGLRELREDVGGVAVEVGLGGGSGRFEGRAAGVLGKCMRMEGWVHARTAVEALVHPRAGPMLEVAEEGFNGVLGKRGREDEGNQNVANGGEDVQMVDRVQDDEVPQPQQRVDEGKEAEQQKMHPMQDGVQNVQDGVQAVHKVASTALVEETQSEIVPEQPQPKHQQPLSSHHQPVEVQVHVESVKPSLDTQPTPIHIDPSPTTPSNPNPPNLPSLQKPLSPPPPEDEQELIDSLCFQPSDTES